MKKVTFLVVLCVIFLITLNKAVDFDATLIYIIEGYKKYDLESEKRIRDRRDGKFNIK